ncbi:barstar family protein [Streptomyces sp. NBC_01613]|uniref:barstar family protein n=1 Tax=Streptomyces sp. NBC_01613 TaxID=2975896 RepID=UPI00386C2595
MAAETATLHEQGGLVLRLDGRDLLEPVSLFRAFARELSFPGYFGHNWDALVDCLHDWHGPGHRQQSVAILIDGADDLLGAEFLGLFVSVLCQAAWRANLQLDADGTPHEDRAPFALHFVFLLDHTPPTAFEEAASKGTDVGVALANGRLTATLTGADRPGADPVSDSNGTAQLPVAGEFLMRLDSRMLEYFRDMAEEMVSRFGISRAEAVARINERYGALDISPYPDLMCHELPQFWAYGAYYYPDDEGRLPTGDSEADADIDVTRLAIRPVPCRSQHPRPFPHD